MVEGARLESACTLTRCTEGSNPSLSAILRSFDQVPNGELVEPQAQDLFELYYRETGEGWRPEQVVCLSIHASKGAINNVSMCGRAVSPAAVLWD